MTLDVSEPGTSGSAVPREPLIVVMGNPNVGKTTLFNELTGQNAHVGNYPGVTIERRSGRVVLPTAGASTRAEVVDVPGAYSLSARSAEEQIALSSALGLGGIREPDLVLLVVDAGQLPRTLYLVLQVLELGVPAVLALNMIDEVGEARPSAERLGALLGVPCVATNARRGEGVEPLRALLGQQLTTPTAADVAVRYPETVRAAADAVASALPAEWRRNVERDRALALWALTSLDADDELEGIGQGLRDTCREVHERYVGDLDRDIVAARYAFIDAHMPGVAGVTGPLARDRLSDRLDRVLLHPVYGFALFVLVMVLVFQSLFSWADPMIGLIEDLVGWLGGVVTAALPPGLLLDFISGGLIAGVGNVVVFLPQILLLFLFVGLLENSGYMARVAYLMDRIMKSLGLHGRAFVPMLSGFACAVPAIMATRTIERQRDRLVTMLVIPLMTCSARLPVYSLIIAALFPPSNVFGWIPVQALLLVSLYLFSTVTTLVAAAVIGRLVVKTGNMPLILELPPYRFPDLRLTLQMMWQRARLFLKEAGTVILACTVVLWFLLEFPRPAVVPSDGRAGVSAVERATAIEQSYGGRLGKFIEPAIEPLGFDWKIGVGLVGAFAAREVFVSTMGIVYGVGDVDEASQPLRDRMRAETRPDGRAVYTPLTGLSLMVFFALACQCMSTLAVVRRETRSWRWPAFMFGYMTALAYAASLAVYQLGRLLI